MTVTPEMIRPGSIHRDDQHVRQTCPFGSMQRNSVRRDIGIGDGCQRHEGADYHDQPEQAYRMCDSCGAQGDAGDDPEQDAVDQECKKVDGTIGVEKISADRILKVNRFKNSGKASEAEGNSIQIIGAIPWS